MGPKPLGPRCGEDAEDGLAKSRQIFDIYEGESRLNFFHTL
jgi:hypothetical protein